MIKITYADWRYDNIPTFVGKTELIYNWLNTNVGPCGSAWNYHVDGFVTIQEEFSTQATAFKLLYGI